MASITCQDCAATHEARKDCKVCPPCRLFRNLMFCAGKWKRAKKCRTCGDPFRPIHARDLSYCAACELRVSKRAPATVACLFCKEDHPAAQKGVPVCMHCAKDPHTQERVLAALRRGVDSRRAKRDSGLVPA